MSRIRSAATELRPHRKAGVDPERSSELPLTGHSGSRKGPVRSPLTATLAPRRRSFEREIRSSVGDLASLAGGCWGESLRP
jgi:hypothetical protein